MEGRRGPRIPAGAYVAALLILAVTVAGLMYAYSRPVPVEVVAGPNGCTIEILGVTEGDDSLTFDDLAPGLYTAEVKHRGFETLTQAFTVKRFQDNTFAFELEPQDQHLSITAPAEATCVVRSKGVELAQGTGSVAATLPAGLVEFEVVQAGFNTYTREIMLDRDTVVEIKLDPEGQLVHILHIMEAAGAPKGAEFTPDGSQIWTTILNGPPAVLVYDVVTGELVKEIEMGSDGAVEVTFSQDGSIAYVTQMETASVYEIDTETYDIVRNMSTNSAWSKVVILSPAGDMLYVSNWSGDDISEIELATGEVTRRFRTGNTPRGIYVTPDGLSLYVATFDGGELQRVDLETGTVETLYDSDGALRHIVGDPEAGLLYISDMRKDIVLVHDMATGVTSEFVATDEKPNTICLSPDGRILYVSCRGENNADSYYLPGPEWGTILLFETDDGTPLYAIVGGKPCTAL
ncbi:MAG: beta-propeller fold lactonase family protein, partial [Actinomycetota bacterium]|nr:beta-propeller fold lactonase family protein [Actinomycetota bacterium]